MKWILVLALATALCGRDSLAKPATPSAQPTVEVLSAKKTPTPVPSPSVGPITALAPSAQQLADVRTVQIVSQVNAFASAMRNALDNGVPARGNQPAISAADLKVSIGPANVARIEAALAALK